MTTAGGTLDVTARLTYVPRDPHVITVAITDRAGAVLIWTIGRPARTPPGKNTEPLTAQVARLARDGLSNLPGDPDTARLPI
jgi:hypothetical protein